MKARVIYDIATRKVVAGGCAEFSPKAGQAMFEIEGDLPHNLTSAWMVEAGRLRPMTPEELAADVAVEADRRKDLAGLDPRLRAGLLVLAERAGMTPQELAIGVRAKLTAEDKG